MTRTTLAIIGLAALLVLGGVAIGGLESAGAQPTDTSTDRTITTAGTGSAEASPDQASLQVAVTATGEDAAAVRETLATDAAALRSALDDVGATYTSERFAIDERRRPPREEHKGDDAETSPTYRGIHSFTVTVDDPDETGAVIDAAAGAGAEIDRVQLTLSDERRSELRNRAIDDAMTDARTQATTIAASGDLSVTDIATVDASESRFHPVRVEMAADGGGDGAAPPTVIDSGEVSVSYNVQVVYNATTA